MTRPKLSSRRRFLLQMAAGGVGLTASGFYGVDYATRVEPIRLELTRTRIHLPQLKRVVRLVQLSDWHISNDVPMDLIEKSVEVAIDQEPDVICLTGDYITNEILDPERMADLFRQLSMTAPTFAVMGNHDGTPYQPDHSDGQLYEALTRILRESGVRVLSNESNKLRLMAGPELMIAGLGDLWRGPVAPNQALSFQRRENIPVIVLAHNPDTKRNIAHHDWDLMLSGHTHGGQVCIPFMEAHFAPVADKSTYSGYYRWHDRHLYITRGVGNLHGIRFNCRPEVSLLELLPKA
ncbi:MAG: metallophosphoesterase [Puniceicoccaceae bacterium 5H]|nr:MAG: metallophosphoesterase [Puniceicoccaceae bacterium 5H]